jgi:hypothetical protein
MCDCLFYVGSRTVAFVADFFAPDPARSDLRYRLVPLAQRIGAGGEGFKVAMRIDARVQVRRSAPLVLL